MPRRTRRISHTTVVAYLALFVALGGSAFAAATITGRDVVDRSLTGVDIRNNSVRSADVRGVTGADLGAGAPWTLRSPDKRFSVSVTNAGVRIQGPGSSVVVNNAGVSVDGAATTDISAAGTLDLKGAVINLNGGCSLLANAGQVYQHQHETSGNPGPTSVGFGAPPNIGTTVRAC
jgi:hypothetical protein